MKFILFKATNSKEKDIGRYLELCSEMRNLKEDEINDISIINSVLYHYGVDTDYNDKLNCSINAVYNNRKIYDWNILVSYDDNVILKIDIYLGTNNVKYLSAVIDGSLLIN